MKRKNNPYSSSVGVRIAQVISMIVMWVFVISISLWIFNLLSLSVELSDALEASIGISIVAIPVYVTLACVLTYVFVSLRLEERRLEHSPPED
jgi:uncharacterized protein YebE (UPF0316 family)